MLIKDIKRLNGIAHHLVNILCEQTMSNMGKSTQAQPQWGRVHPLVLPRSIWTFEACLRGSPGFVRFLKIPYPRKPKPATAKTLHEGGVTRTLICCHTGLPDMSNPPSKAPDPKLYDLQKPEKLSKILKEDRDDCLSCRLVGQFFLAFHSSSG